MFAVRRSQYVVRNAPLVICSIAASASLMSLVCFKLIFGHQKKPRNGPTDRRTDEKRTDTPSLIES